jgi:transaldolase
VPSVASVFISRWDSAADPLLPSALHGSLGLAMAQKTYASHVQLLSDQRWQALAEAGARPQRVLWASTSTKGAAPRTAIKEKAAKLTQHARGKIDEG